MSMSDIVYLSKIVTFKLFSIVYLINKIQRKKQKKWTKYKYLVVRLSSAYWDIYLI